MKDNVKTSKIALIISSFSVIISLIGIIIAVMNLRYSISNGKPTGSPTTLFWCMLAIFFANITQFIISIKRYKKHCN